MGKFKNVGTHDLSVATEGLFRRSPASHRIEAHGRGLSRHSSISECFSDALLKPQVPMIVRRVSVSTDRGGASAPFS
jgi:hypothetical protein